MQNTQYCEECLEDISDANVYWENDRAYCGQCGGELDMTGDAPDLTEEFPAWQKTAPVSPNSDAGGEEAEEDGEMEEEAES